MVTEDSRTRIDYRPYNVLVPNSDGMKVDYPISFGKPIIKNDTISYTVGQGRTKSGMKFSAVGLSQAA